MRANKCFVAKFILLLLSAGINCNNNGPSIIIVGAGAAGFAAAVKLVENGLNNVIILEAEGRIGGRINSVEFGDAVVDLGAQWCHGEQNNTVYELVKHLDLLEPRDLSLQLYHSSKKYIDPNLGSELLELYNVIYDTEKEDNKISLGDYILKRYNESVIEHFKDKTKQQLALEGIDVVKKWTLLRQGAFSWFDPAAQSDYKECLGTPGLNWKGRGHKMLLEVLTKKYPDPSKELPVKDKIILNKEVTRIVWSKNDKDTARTAVECLDGSKYTADHVISTVSLGVLKNQYKTLFSPSLPADKIEAIETLGIGAVAKVYLHFPTRWWATSNFKDFTFLWSRDDLYGSAQEFPEGSSNDGKSWVTDLLGFHRVEENPNVLEGWFFGEFVPEIELLSNDTIIEGVMFVLNKFLGDQFHIIKPDAMLQTKWYSNPHFRGTYSFQTVESRKRGISQEVVLSQPLTSGEGKQTLLFAGEATHPVYYSTAHGAVESGFREAERLLKLYK